MATSQGERVSALKQGLNINPLALSGQPTTKAPAVRPYAASEPPAAEATPALGPPPPRPPKPSRELSSTSIDSLASPYAPAASYPSSSPTYSPSPVLFNPYDASGAGQAPPSRRASVSVALGPIPTLPSLESMLGTAPASPEEAPSRPPARPPRHTTGSSRSTGGSSQPDTFDAPDLDEVRPPASSDRMEHLTRNRVQGPSLTPRRPPTNKNQEIRELRAQVAAIQSGHSPTITTSTSNSSSSSSIVSSLSSSSGGGGDTVTLSRNQLAELEKERDNFRLAARKLQEEAQKNKQQLEELRSSRRTSEAPLDASSAAIRLRELEEQIKSRDATIVRLRSENARREAELLQSDSSFELQNPQLERERQARQREELDQMKSEEAKAEVARLRGQIVQLRRAMERRIAQLEEDLETETKNSVNLMAEKRKLEERLRKSSAGSSPVSTAYFTPSSVPDLVDADDSYPEPDLRRAKNDLYAANPSSQYADVPLLSAADFSNPPPLRPKSQATKISPSKPADMCASCVIA